MEIQNIRLLRECGQVAEIEEATCPRASMRDLRGVEGTIEESIKAYLREHYIGAFTFQ